MVDKKIWFEAIDGYLRKWFGLQPGWHKDLDIIKNNYVLARRYIAEEKYQEAVYRLKFLTWLDSTHKAGLLDLARAHIALKQNAQAHKALDKLLAVDAQHAEAKRLKAALASGNVSIAPVFEIVAELDAKPYYEIHKECFPLFWKEAEIAEMLLISGTQGTIARMKQPVGMLITRAQFEQAEVLTIGVIPAARGKDVAKRLMAEAEKKLRAQGVRKIFLEVAENNEDAVGLYRSIGYKETSRRKEYYRQMEGPPVDALVMSKELV